MHWGQIKTLLIISFLLLDVYLFIQYMDKREESDFSMWEYQESTIEDQLITESIKIQNLPDKEYEESFITVKQMDFTDNKLFGVKDLAKQDPYIFNQYFLASKLDKAQSIPKNKSDEEMMLLLNKLVYGASEYSYWGMNEELNVLIYFQNKLDRPVYYNQNGLILLFLNEKDEVEYYTQTMLGEAETLSENMKLIKPIQAIEILYKANSLYTGDEISSVNIGFHTRVPSETGVQVFAPIWRVNVNGEADYFINAIEGLINTTNDEEFLISTFQAGIERMDGASNTDKVVKSFKDDLQERIDNLYRSEEE